MLIRQFCPHVLFLIVPGLAGCPQVPEDGFEPNDTPEQATPLTLDVAVTARVVQGNADMFAVDAQPVGGTTLNELRFELESLGGDECATFTVSAPDGAILYKDTNPFCSRAFYEPEKVPAAVLDYRPGESYTLTVPAETSGTYLLVIEEKGHADNVFDYFWDYRVTARLPVASP